MIHSAAIVPAYPFGKNKVNREVFTWNMLKTIHFDIYYPYGMEDIAGSTAKIVEEGYVRIADYLNHELTQVIPVIIYPSHIDFQENNILLQIIGEGTGGFTEAFKNRVVVPFTGSYGEFRHVVTHELVHAFQYNMLFDDTSGAVMSHFSYGGMPLWVMEGMSEYLSIGFDETADMVMRDLIYNEQYATLMELTMLHVKSGYLLYKEGQAFYYFLEQKYGREKVGELFRDARDLSNFDEVLQTITGKTIEELNLEWLRFYKKRYYPIVRGKNFDEEEGVQYTFHQKTESSFNVCPAVSPDGKKIAYITNMDVYACVSVVDVDGKKEKKIRTLVRGDTTSKFEGMHLLSNYLTWSADGRHIVFVSQSSGRDVIFIIDAQSGRIVEEVGLPFRQIMDPSLSRDGGALAFAGQKNGMSDIYIYYRAKKVMRRITNDCFVERYPKITDDNLYVLYSANCNPENDYERDDFNIVRCTIATGEREVIIASPGNDLQSDLSVDGKELLYISNRTGIYNAYRYSFATRTDVKVTDVLCGVFYPRWFPAGDRMAFVGYQNIGYDIFVKELLKEPAANSAVAESAARDTDYLRPAYPRSYFDISRSVFDPYSTHISPDWIFFGIGGTVGYGFAGFARMAISDYLGEHRIILSTDYLSYGGSNQDFNFDAAYYYLKYRWDYGFGVFRQKNPYGIITLASINDLIHNAYYDTLYMDHYGAYAIASYPFSKFFRFNIRGTTSRYERAYSALSDRPDVFANLNQVAFSLNYDNVLWGPMVPLDGMRGQLEVEQSFNLTGQDFVFTTATLDLRKYFLLSKKYVIALRGSGGKIFGRDSEYFKFYIGGFNSLRGHPFLEYGGENFFLCNADFRFIFIEGIKMGWPLFFRMGAIGGVLFTDFGSAWDNHYTFIDSTTGRFADFKSDVGFGFRLTLYPLIILKLDYAWPYYYKSFGDREISFSLGFEY